MDALVTWLRGLFSRSPKAQALEASAISLFEQAHGDLLEASRLYTEQGAAAFKEAQALLKAADEARYTSDDLAHLAKTALERAERIGALIA